jgi:hypothetical protein
MTRWFRLYEWGGPLLVTPLALACWLTAFSGAWAPSLVATIVPVLHAYIVPGIGTNVLKVWRIHSPFALGGFRWQHGFLFGSTSALVVALTVLGLEALPGGAGPLPTAIVAAAVLLAINWIYDVIAIRAGVLEVYNQPWSQGAGAWSITADYVVWFFGLFGFIYTLGVALLPARMSAGEAASAIILLTAATTLVPTAFYMASSKLRHGHSGCRPIPRAGGHA